MTAEPVSQRAARRGAQPWRRHIGLFAWPTLIFGVLTVVAYGISTWAALAGRIPLWTGGLLNTLLGYFAFTTLHEASHGNIHGHRRSLRWLNEALGWANGLLILAPFPAFKRLHLRHHAHTNDPEVDPDFWVAGQRLWRVLLACATILPHYYRLFLTEAWRDRRTLSGQQKATLLAIAGILGAIAAAVTGGFGREVLALWVVPALLATLVLGFLFDWLPHQPHDVQERFRDTKILLFPGFRWIFLWQNYHLIHHLFPTIPFYRYDRCFEEMRDDLEAKGAPIVELGKR